MVTVVCDLCGRTQEEVRRHTFRDIYRFEKYQIDKDEEPEAFDICENCLIKIRDQVLNLRGGTIDG